MAACNTTRCTMAAEAAAEILSQKLEMLLSHPVCVRCSLMEPLAKEAKEKLATIQEFFYTQVNLPQSTVWWLGRLLQAMYDAEESIDKFHLREARGRHEALHMATRLPSALISKCKLWRDLSNLVNKMQELCQDQCLKGKKEAEGKTRKESACSSSPASVPGQDEKLARLSRLWEWQASMNIYWREEMEKIKEAIGKGEEKVKKIKKIKEEGIGGWGLGIWDWGGGGENKGGGDWGEGGENKDREEEEEQIKTRVGGSPGNVGLTLLRGERGVGKTSLARWVYREAMYLGFKWRAWVHLSDSMDMQELLFEILKQMRKLAREVKDKNLQEITEMHPNDLAKWKKFLVVLDGVHASNAPLLRKLVNILNHGSGHIIITTQDDRLAQVMNFPEWLIVPRKLNPVESQKMLAIKLRRAPDGENLPNNDGILETCQGLPLRISLLGGLLPDAGEQERAALAKDDFKMSLPDILELSYQKLPVPLKPCFIYMVLFPRASPILTRKLVRLWLAEGLLNSHCYDQERKPTRLPEDVGETFILELAERNVIDVVSWRADGSPKACYMLTYLYDIIHPIMMDTCFLHVHATRKSKDENDPNPTGQQQQVPAQQREIKVRWLAEHTNIVRDSHGSSYPGLNLRHVRSFLSFYMRRGMLTKDFSTFLRKMTSKISCSLLRVLDLEGVYKPSLQGVLHKLVLLKYLGLRSTALHTIPRAVADLQYLETLDIKDTYITSLPNSFWMARNLRHLHLNWFHINLKTILKARSNNAKALTKLQTLSGLVIGEVKENFMKVHMDSLTTLKLFLHQLDRDNSGAAGKAVADWISSKLTNLQSLTLEVTKKAQPTKEAKPETSQIGPLPKLLLAGHHELFSLYLLGQLDKPIWEQLLPVSLRVLTLSGSRVEEDMMPQLGGPLRHLRTFRLLANSFLGSSLTFAKDGFPSLKFLKIWKLPNLKNVIIQPGAIQNLQELELRHLDAMKSVEGIEACKHLENIRVAVKKGAQCYVDQLEKKIGREKHLYKIEDTDNEDDSDDDNEAMASP